MSSSCLATQVKYDKSDVLGNDVLEHPNNMKACLLPGSRTPWALWKRNLGNTAGKNIQTGAGRTGVENGDWRILKSLAEMQGIKRK